MSASNFSFNPHAQEFTPHKSSIPHPDLKPAEEPGKEEAGSINDTEATMNAKLQAEKHPKSNGTSMTEAIEIEKASDATKADGKVEPAKMSAPKDPFASLVQLAKETYFNSPH
jgi:hypothetical protein